MFDPKKEEARQAREAKLDELHERLSGAVEQLVSGDDWRCPLAFAALAALGAGRSHIRVALAS